MDSLKITYFVTGLAVIAIGVFGYFSYKKTAVVPTENIQATTTPQVVVTDPVYKNTKYGFGVTLPKSWAGYTITEEDWEGTAPGSADVVETGPFIFIHHPLSTEMEERQDIPVMVFTLSQWSKLEKDELSISAAPVNPTELSRNKKYVFALPARYNYSFLTGHEEVDQIIKSGALKAF